MDATHETAVPPWASATPPPLGPGTVAGLWEAVWRTSGEFIAIVDRDGIIQACNRVSDGFTVEQIVGQSLTRFTVSESSARLERAVRDVFETSQPQRLETTVQRHDGEHLYFTLRLGPIQVAGRTTAVMVCCEDMRQLKISEGRLRQERNVLRRLLDIQERERQLVSYEIHDGLAQYLTGAIMQLQTYQHQRSGADQPELVEGLRLLQAAAEEARRLIGGLRPPALDELGIEDAVQALIADARIEIPHVVFTSTIGTERLAAHLETAIFRIVQESLSNVRRHAGATHVSVALDRLPHAIRIHIADDGCGFDATTVPEERFGLEGIRQRALLLGGHASIASAPGAGTTIDAELPLPA
jgi:PAS domain S-box-containing protein